VIHSAQRINPSSVAPPENPVPMRQPALDYGPTAS
jgi:hypothetical protein